MHGEGVRMDSGEEEGRGGGEGGEAVQMRNARFESMPKFE